MANLLRSRHRQFSCRVNFLQRTLRKSVCTSAVLRGYNRPERLSASISHDFRFKKSVRMFSSDSGVLEKVPTLGDSISEGEIVNWEKEVGDYVNVDDVLCVIETDKVSVDIRSTVAGVLLEQIVEAGESIEVGANLAKIDTSAESTGQKSPAAAPAAEASKEIPVAAVPAAPAAPSPTPTPSPSPSPSPAPAPAPAGTASPPGSRKQTREKMSRMRQTIAKRLKDSQNTLAMLTTFNEIDMSAIMALRSKHKDDFLEKHGVKLGFMSAFVKASTAALMQFPDANASIDGKEIVYHDYADISIAVATPTGLVTPVLRNAEAMSFADVEGTIAGLGKKAREGKITMADMLGGTFTISNGGVYGSMFGTPIVNPPQTAILGMHGIHKRPVAIGDKVEIRPMMYIALTYDHRLIDGGTSVLFLRKIKEMVEDPTRLLLDL